MRLSTQSEFMMFHLEKTKNLLIEEFWTLNDELGNH